MKTHTDRVRGEKKKTIGNNNLYNKNAEICLWLFLAGAG